MTVPHGFPKSWLWDRTWPLIKICGLTQKENALACATAGADMIGLVFFPKSPRHVTLVQAKTIAQALPPHVLACGVFVDTGYEKIAEVAQFCRLKGVQLHGNEPASLALRLSDQGLFVIKAFFASRPPLIPAMADYPGADLGLVEYGKGPLPGGNAEDWDYSLVSRDACRLPLMLAGGLGPRNVAQAIDRARPRAVDASSGLESAPGIKDLDKVRTFISTVRGSSL